MAIEGAVTADIQRNFGDKFFLKAEYTIEGIPKPRTWTFRRSWQDFKKLDKWIRREWDLMELPPEPYLLGAESDTGPFRQYLAQIMSLDELMDKPQMYEFLGTPNDVLVAMLPGKVPIDVAVKEGSTRYKGESEGFSVPVLDPVMLAESAGKNVAEVNKKLAEAEIAKKAGAIAGERADEWKEALGEVKVDSKATGKAFGNLIGNLKSGKGLFGEEATTKFASQVMTSVGLTEQEAAAQATAQQKWDLKVKAPSGSGLEDLEVTVRPSQKWKVLLKAMGGGEEGGKKMAISVQGSVVDAEAEIGASGVGTGATVEVVYV
eukprot:CAMPEP_0177702282 /NCGR_PEP_ID=MMETSP0484_2-20121128/7054_1 /TAXON_ID=354590 /ORGANISM="Rhodomonas lens, Strain RHODO" /LENGTH=318 /DNA_ID=CAMNT_0019213557 /DNA_START=90 /DNA_END=1046 /DNA_ORIENTATION=-